VNERASIDLPQIGNVFANSPKLVRPRLRFGFLTLSLRTRGRTDRETINRRNRSIVPTCPRPCKNLESAVVL